MHHHSEDDWQCGDTQQQQDRHGENSNMCAFEAMLIGQKHIRKSLRTNNENKSQQAKRKGKKQATHNRLGLQQTYHGFVPDQQKFILEPVAIDSLRRLDRRNLVNKRNHDKLAASNASHLPSELTTL